MAIQQYRTGFNSWFIYDDDQIELTEEVKQKVREQADEHVSSVLYPRSRKE